MWGVFFDLHYKCAKFNQQKKLNFIILPILYMIIQYIYAEIHTLFLFDYIKQLKIDQTILSQWCMAS